MSNITDTDELHLIKIMFDTELTIRCGNEESESFKTDTGILQGDGPVQRNLLYTCQILSTNETSNTAVNLNTKMNTFA